MNRFNRRKRDFWLLCGGLSLLLVGLVGSTAVSRPASGQTFLDISLLGIEANYPEIEVAVRITDAVGRAPEQIEAGLIDLYENGEAVPEFEILPASGLPKLTALYVDSGAFSTVFLDFAPERVRAALTPLSGPPYFAEGVDQLLLAERLSQAGRDETIFHVPPTSSANLWLDGLDRLEFPLKAERTEGLAGLQEVLEAIRNGVEGEPSSASAVIFFVHNVNWPPQSEQIERAEELAALARSQQTRIYVLHADPTGQYPDPFEILAQESGGLYLNPTDRNRLAEALGEIYRDIDAQSTGVLLRYRSRLTEPGERQIAVVQAGMPFDQASAVGTVLIEPPPATVLIESRPEVRRTRTEGGGLTPSFLPIQARIESWPYALEPGDLVSAELLVDQFVEESVETPDLTGLTFNLNISGIEEPAGRDITVRVTDRFGLTVLSRQTKFLIDVESQPEITSVEPQPNLLTANELEATIPDEAAGVGFCAADRPGWQGWLCQLQDIEGWLPWGIALLTTLSGLGLFFRLRRSAPGKGTSSTPARAGGVAQWTKTILGGAVENKRPFASLTVLKGPHDLVNESVDIYSQRTTIGRDSARCDILLYDENSASSISGLHLTIQNDMGRFWVTDSSNNGSKINGKSLVRDQPVEIHNGDELLLGDLFRKGALLKFEILDSGAAQSGAAFSQSTGVERAQHPQTHAPVKEGSGRAFAPSGEMADPEDEDKTVIEFPQPNSYELKQPPQLASEMIPDLEEDDDWQSQLS